MNKVSYKLTVMGKYSRKYVHTRQLLTQCDLRPPLEGVSLSRYSQPAYSAPRIHQSLRHKSTNSARQTWAGERERHTCVYDLLQQYRDWTLERCVFVLMSHTHTHTRCVTNFVVDRLTAGALMVCGSKVPGSVLMHKHEKCLMNITKTVKKSGLYFTVIQ